MRRATITRGDRFGHLTVVKELKPHVYPSGVERRLFGCRCDCGNKVKVVINSLRSGLTKSCGCKKTTHGLRKHPLYSVWQAIHTRCYNQNQDQFHDYGGRGIKVCRRWHRDNPDGLQNFIGDMEDGYEKGLTIERTDNSKNYTPANCVWATRSEQSFNRRKRKGSSSKYHGVSWTTKNEKWKVQVRLSDGSQKYVGLFLSDLEAAKVYNDYIEDNGLEAFNHKNLIESVKLAAGRREVM